MIKSVHIKKGYQPRIEGRVPPLLKRAGVPRCVAVCPASIPFIKPRLKVEKGNSVSIGSLLFVDKQNPRLRFLAPGSGRIESIDYGPRRVIEQIVIALDSQEAAIEFPIIDDDQLAAMNRSDLIDMLMAGGVWPFIRALPFREIADPNGSPPAIIIALDDTEPFQPAPEVYLNGNEDLFAFGIRVLKRLCDQVTVAAAEANGDLKKRLDGQINLFFTGKYPAGDPGTLLYHVKKRPRENSSWFIAGQDLLMIARLLGTGRYPTQRIVSVGGGAAKQHYHLQTRLGVSVADLAASSLTTADTRFVSGGLFRGRAVPPDGFLGFYDAAVTLVPEGKEKELLALFNPGWKKISYSRAYLSALNKADQAVNCNRHGEERACIACMHCADVCPVDILPQLAYKAVLIDEVEEALEHGLLDCVECGLCTYVCPSKIELLRTFQTAKAAYRKERQSE